MDNAYQRGQIDTLHSVVAHLDALTKQLEAVRGRQDAIDIVAAFAQTLASKAEQLEKEFGQ